MKKFILCFALNIFFKALYSQVIPAVSPGTDLMGTVKSSQWYANGESSLNYNSIVKGFAFTTDSNGNTNHEDWQNSIGCSKTISLTAGHAYQFVLKMKADVFPRGQNIIILIGDQNNNLYKTEVAWNASKAGSWEKIYFPVFPAVSGTWAVMHVFIKPYLKYSTTPSTIYISPDIDLYELPIGSEVVNLNDIDLDADKDTFASSNIRVDALGNIYTHQTDDSWKHVFPKLMYKGYDGSVPIDTVNAKFKRYQEYGFTGIMDVWTATESQAVIDAGMEHIAINANFSNTDEMEYYVNSVNIWATKKNKHDNILWYQYDNENDQIPRYEYNQTFMNYINTNFVDPQTNQRRHPMYFLNGNVGLARLYHNSSTSVMDMTGSYVGSLATVAETSYLPALPTLLTEFVTENQRTPVVVIQLQSYLHEYFVPALFHGIIMGGKALSVWRDGTNFGGSSIDFRQNVWASAFKNDIAPKLDLMLPLIEQSHFTKWKAYTNQFPNVRIGTRELDSLGYLILTNYSDSDLLVTVTLVGREASEAVDMFTGESIAYITDNSFQFVLGHYNQGYRVIQLKNPIVNESSLSSSIEITSSSALNIYPNPLQDKIYIQNSNLPLQTMIYDLQGKMVLCKQTESNFLDISDLPKGIYFVHFIDNQITEVVKILKE